MAFWRNISAELFPLPPRQLAKLKHVLPPPAATYHIWIYLEFPYRQDRTNPLDFEIGSQNLGSGSTNSTVQGGAEVSKIGHLQRGELF